MELNEQSLSKRIAEHLLTIGAITLRPTQPFTWSSGMKSPIYCDNRLTMSYPEVRKLIKDGFVDMINTQFPGTEVIAGTATAGIAHAAWVADAMDLPMIYVRDKAKGHGKENLIEGVLPKDKRVVVIEDLISTGGSSLKAASAVNDAGGQTLGIVAIFTYQLPIANEKFAAQHLPLYTLSRYDDMIEIALQMNIISEQELAIMKAWRDNPEKLI